MAISAMEYGNTTSQPQGEPHTAINRAAEGTPHERLATPKPSSQPCYYELEQILELRNTWILQEQSQANEEAVEASSRVKPRGQEEVLKLADNALSILEKELQAGKSETLLKFLTTMGRFYNYSFNNLMLIAMQNPEATHVAGFQAWKQLGRHVKKGEQGIRILAPIILKRKTEEGEGSTSEATAEAEKNPKMLVGFKAVSVFDISQTDGEPLPDIGSVKGDPGESLSKMEELIRSKGIDLGYEKLYGPEGLSQGGKILVEPDLGPAKTFAVLAHELAHELLHKGDKRKETSRSQRELEAEAVAFVVCHSVGLDNTNHAAEYIQLYNGNAEELSKSLDAIRSKAAEIISGLKS